MAPKIRILEKLTVFNTLGIDFAGTSGWNLEPALTLKTIENFKTVFPGGCTCLDAAMALSVIQEKDSLPEWQLYMVGGGKGKEKDECLPLLPVEDKLALFT